MCIRENEFGERTANLTNASQDADVSVTELRGNVLVVDDCPHGRNLISALLKGLELAVETADNGLVACHRVMTALEGGEAFDLILTDMDMPVMDGYQATSYLRELGYSGRIVALTANSKDGAREECLRCGCDDFAAKPIAFQMLVDLLKRNLPAIDPSVSYKIGRAAASASRLPPVSAPMSA